MPIKISEFSIRDCLVIHYFPVNKVPMVTGILTSLNEAGHWLTRWLQSWQPSFSPNNNYMNFEFIVYPSEGGREGGREKERESQSLVQLLNIFNYHCTMTYLYIWPTEVVNYYAHGWVVHITKTGIWYFMQSMVQQTDTHSECNGDAINAKSKNIDYKNRD